MMTLYTSPRHSKTNNKEIRHFCTAGPARTVSTTVASASLEAFENHLLTVTYCFLLFQ